MKITLPFNKALECLYNPQYRIVCFYGGRGGGKSHGVAQYLLFEIIKNKQNILCTREFQSNIKDSVYSLLCEYIHKLGLNDYFTIKRDEIVCVNGGKIVFYGVSRDIDKIKGIFGIGITWIEEAHNFSKQSWLTLEKSIIRDTQNPRIIITYNPKHTYDFFTEYLVNGKRGTMDNVVVVKVNIDDNPFAPQALLDLREFEKENLSRQDYLREWEGVPYDFNDDSIFANCKLTPCNFFEYKREEFTKVVVACDPATTNKDYSNEYGVFVLGKKRTGEIVGLRDYSGKYTPKQFVMQVSNACNEYQTPYVVVEINNGGDFIKSAILEYDSSLIVSEVRATQDKTTRAIPVASLIESQKVVFGDVFNDLFLQMQKLTTMGYAGQKGESPDRLDSFVWGVYDLANIRDKGTQASVFKPSYFAYDSAFYDRAMCVISKVAYITYTNSKYSGIVVSVYKDKDKVRFLFSDSFATEDLSTIDLSEFSACKFDNLPQLAKMPYKKYEGANIKDFDKIALAILPKIKEGFCQISPDFKERENAGFFGNLLLNELMDFGLNSNLKFYALKAFFDFCKTEFNIKV